MHYAKRQDHSEGVHRAGRLVGAGARPLQAAQRARRPPPFASVCAVVAAQRRSPVAAKGLALQL